MKYRTQSAEVLNEADALERQMDWQLFCAEQEAMLWSDPDDWKPGDPIIEHRWGRQHLWGLIGNFPDFYLEEGPIGNCVRPMFQVFDDTHDDTMDSMNRIRCEDCEVWFGGEEDVCFVCYKKVDPLPVRDRALFGSGFNYAALFMQPNLQRVGQIDEVVATNEGLEVSGRFTFPSITFFDDFDIDRNEIRFTAEAQAPDGETLWARQRIDREDLVSMDTDVVSWLREEMRTMLIAQLADEMHVPRQYIVSPRRQGRTMLGNHMHTWFDEMSNWGPPPVVIPQAAEETPECDEVDFEFTVESLYVDSPTTTPDFVLPQDIDLSGVRPIELPVVDVSGGQLVRTLQDHRYYDSTPITERRRES